MKSKDIQRAEFWIATIFYTLAVFALLTNASNRNRVPGYYSFKEANLTFSYFSNYLVPELFRASILYINFLLLNFLIVPALIKKRDELMNWLLLIPLLGVTCLVLGIAKTYSGAYFLLEYKELQLAYNRIFFNAFMTGLWTIIIIGLYGVVKEVVIYLIENHQKDLKNQSQMKIDIGFGLAFWFVGPLLLLSADGNYMVLSMWTMIIFSAIAIIVYSVYYYIPKLQAAGRKFWFYLGNIILISIVFAVPIMMICLLISSRDSLTPITLLFHIPTQLVVSAPLAWYLHKKRTANTKELFSLRTELGRSDASLSFLQSQINPHFLFNALNTLYGTALQENAERTGEGIQKLGDMMRFMLHENVQDKISLTRDVDYLQNYIALQKLRISRSSAITIDTQIEEQLSNLVITPMLLIPFVENAFKHGISLQQPSHIKVTLQTRANTLYFDVHNSIHIKPDHDPEKLKSGIGLANVKQRLALLYPGKHELIIRESAAEFFIHLTLQL
jgi:two-component system LytT family sensor kinase